MRGMLCAVMLAAVIATGAPATGTAHGGPAAGPAAGATPEPPSGMVTYYLGMLVKGPKWTPGETPELERLQEAHIAHLKSMGATGKLVVAGPLADNGFIRGILVFKTATLDEAKAMAEEDPAVKAGRLVVEMHPWMVQKGALP